MFEQLKQQFLATFADKIEYLHNALENQDAQALTVAVHQLAGSSGSYGFAAISALCNEIECLVHDHSIDLNVQEKTQNLISLMTAQIKETV